MMVEKVVVPKFVATYIEKSKERGCELSAVFAYFNTPSIPDNIDRWLYDNTDAENDRRFSIAVRAWVEGYEVEEEKEYVWRKKKEHLASFENNQYLRIIESSTRGFAGDTIGVFEPWARYSESTLIRYLGVDDFNLFEKVED